MAATRQASGDVIGDYRLEDYLGGGAFGAVWRAVDTRDGSVVAVKILAAIDKVDARAEIELLAATASSTSEHVVRVLGGDTAPVPYIVMEYVEGSDLAESLTERGRLPIDEALKVGTALADALVALERAGIVHRDVKPGNVLISKDGVIKLADFGIAKIAGLATVTSTRQAPMTMAYAAPEVWDGHATKASDFYAFGCVIYQCLAGEVPFSGGVGELYKAHAERTPDLTPLPFNTPPSLRALISKCLEKGPANRPGSAVELLTAMNRASVELNELANAMTTSSEPRKFGPWLRREPSLERAWTWNCVHETTGEAAVVEVHAFAAVDEGEVLERAFRANPALAERGAERILGTNRLLLRPGERWLSEPAGEFLFWVARERLEVLPSFEPTREQVAEAAAQLARLREAAITEGLQLEMTGRTLAWTADGLKVLRPGLPPLQDVADEAATVAWLTHHVEEADRDLLVGGSLAGLATALSAPRPGVAEEAEALAPAGFSTTTSGVFATGEAGPLAPGHATHEAHHSASGVAPVAVAPPKKRRPAMPLAAVGVASLGAAFGIWALLFGGDDPEPPPAATPTPVVQPFEIKSVDCAPSTVEIGATVSCEATFGGAADGVTYAWAAEGATPADGKDATFALSFATEGERKRIILQACDASGKCLEKSAFVSVNDPSIGPPPESAFSCAPNPAKSGERVSCVSLANGEGLKWSWEAPTGTTPTAASQQLSTSFSGAKSHDITLTVCRVVGEKQACATGKQTILLLADPTPVPPTATPRSGGGGSTQPPAPPAVPIPPVLASVICTPTSPKIGETVYCSANVSGDSSRTWLASGGSPASGSSAAFSTAFPTAGPKTILIEVCNNAGCSSGSATVAVSDVPAPEIDLICTPPVIVIGGPISCWAEPKSGTVTSWSWNAPGGSPATGTNSTFVATYNTYGSKTVSVTGCNGTSCATVSANFVVDPPWQPPRQAPPTGAAPTNPPALPTPTPTPLATATPVPNATNTPTQTTTPVPGATNTPTRTPTNTPTPSPTPWALRQLQITAAGG